MVLLLSFKYLSVRKKYSLLGLSTIRGVDHSYLDVVELLILVNYLLNLKVDTPLTPALIAHTVLASMLAHYRVRLHWLGVNRLAQ